MIPIENWRRHAKNDMVVMIDTNVIIDFLLKREPYDKAATEILRKCAEKEITGYVAFHSVPNIWYILRKIPEDKRRKWLMDLCSILQVAGASHEEVIKAIADEKFGDFEDCLQDRCARSSRAQYIITRNVKDFTGSNVLAIAPEDFLKLINSPV